MGYYIQPSCFPYPRISIPYSHATRTPLPNAKQPLPQVVRLSIPIAGVSIPIPLEVILNILEEVYSIDQQDTGSNLLYNCCLVSKSWLDFAQRMLYRDVVLRNASAYRSFRSGIIRAAARGVNLRHVVRRLQITLDPTQQDPLWNKSFAHALLLCPNLTELTVHLFGQDSRPRSTFGAQNIIYPQTIIPLMDDNTFSLLRKGPKVKALRLFNYTERSGNAAELLCAFPFLNSLSLHGNPVDPPILEPNATDSSPLLFPCKLRELKLDLGYELHPRNLRWLTQGSMSTLKHIELASEPSAMLLEYLVETYGPVIASLSLPSCCSHSHLHAVQRCQRLTSLRVDNSWTSPSLYSKLPSTLSSFAFTLDVDTPLHAVIKAVKSRSGRLSTLIIHVKDSGSRHALLPTLRQVCAEHHVQVLMTSNVYRFRSLAVI